MHQKRVVEMKLLLLLAASIMTLSEAEPTVFPDSTRFGRSRRLGFMTPHSSPHIPVVGTSGEGSRGAARCPTQRASMGKDNFLGHLGCSRLSLEGASSSTLGGARLGKQPVMKSSGRRPPLCHALREMQGSKAGRAEIISLRMTAAAEDSKVGFQGVGPAEGGWGKSVGVEEESRLPEDNNLLRGALQNGLRYCIKVINRHLPMARLAQLPAMHALTRRVSPGPLCAAQRNKMPAGRFLVNLEVHSGSVDEDDDEQGIAHFLEHMLFLGTERFQNPDAMRTVLGKLGMSQLADANAYTDFRSTVYTLSAPTRGEDLRGKYDMEASSAAANRDTLFRSGLVSVPVTVTTLMPTEAGDDDDEYEDESEDDEDQLEAAAASQGAGNETNVGLVIDLLHQMSFRALIRQESVDSERGAILNEYRDTKDLSDRVASKYYRQMFAETALPDRFPIGKEELIMTFTAEQIRSFYDKHYHPSNMHIFVVGDVDEAEVLEEIRRTFGTESPVPRKGGGGDLPGLSDTPANGKMSEWPVRGKQIHHAFGERRGVPYESVTHNQITDFSLTLTVKEPLESNDRVSHLREGMLDTLVGMAIGFRTDEVVSSCEDPPFTRVDWNYFNSAREGCVLNSITVSGEARHWKGAILEGLRCGCLALSNTWHKQPCYMNNLVSHTWHKQPCHKHVT